MILGGQVPNAPCPMILCVSLYVFGKQVSGCQDNEGSCATLKEHKGIRELQTGEKVAARMETLESSV